MAVLNRKIKPVAVGDDFRVERTYTKLPAAVIAQAWLTVKLSEGLPDNQAIIHKPITATPGANGHITDADTAPDGILAMYFDPSAAETINAKPDTPYFYGIKVRENGSNKIHHLEKGTISFVRRNPIAII